MPGLLGSLIFDRLKDAGRHAANKAAFYASAAIFAVLALAFLGIAGFAALSTIIEPSLAALSVAGAFVVLALLCVALASRRPRRRESSGGDVMATAMTALPAIAAPLRNVRAKPVRSILTAVAVGAFVAVLTRNRSDRDHV